ncbi:MAG TPA: acetolactate synthase small subunit [Armatimonadota bacterium]|nr:acetolactate synthase small subunit [Armatimonadota bacterium]
MTHTITAIVQDHPGVLARVAGLFARRGFNIASLSVNRTHRPGMSRMVICVDGDQLTLEQITKQLHKLVEVLKVWDHVDDPVVQRELALIKVDADARTRSEIFQIATIFRAQIVDVSDRTVTIECTGLTDKIDALVRMLEPFGIKETARTGRVILVRGFQDT